jgi:hypothetical protein
VTTVSAPVSHRDSTAPGVTESLVNCALACVPAPRPPDQTVTDAERGAAVHDVASAITSGLPYLTEQDRRELAAVLLGGLPDMAAFVTKVSR